MDNFFKICAGVLITAVLSIMLSRQEKDLNLMLIIAACSMVVISAMTFLQPVIAFADRIVSMSGLNEELISVIVKAVGIGLVSEITCLICTDAGNSALAKVLQILTSAVILWISIPLFERLLDTMDEILGTL